MRQIDNEYRKREPNPRSFFKGVFLYAVFKFVLKLILFWELLIPLYVDHRLMVIKKAQSIHG